MKIVFLTSGTIKSSLSYRPLAFAKKLTKRGHDVYVIAPRFDKYSNFKDEGIKEIDGVKIIRPLQIKTFSFELGLIPYIFSSIFYLIRLNPDVIHIFKPNPITIGGILLKIIKGTPVILDLDDLDSEVMKVEKNSKLKIKLVEISEKLLLKYTSATTVASTFLKKLYSKTYKNKQFVIISNGAEFNISKKRLAKTHNHVVFIGNMNRINILEPIFYAIKELDKDVHFSATIIGSGTYLNYFKRLSKKLKIMKRVTFTGHVEQDKLKNYIHEGDIGYCYMPDEVTIRACSSMKIFQYMQFGAIPLVSNVGDFPLYIYNGKAGYIAESSDIHSLANTMKEALVNRVQRKEKQSYEEEHAKHDYQWATLTNKVEQLYKKIV